jgi:hypothetical protein
MTERVLKIPDSVFTEAWNTATSLSEVVERVKALVGAVPRWSVMARAAALRRSGIELQKFRTIA